MKKILALMLFLILFSIPEVVFSAPENIGIVQKQIKIDNQNKNVNMVLVDLNSKDIELGVVVSNDIVGGNEDFLSMIKRKNAVAAINANFFDAYKSLEPIATIMKDKKIIYMEGENSSMVISDKRKVNFDKFKIVARGYLNGQRENRWNNNTQAMDFYLFDIWYVNRLPSDGAGVYLYTPDRGESIKLYNGTAIEVIDDKIIRTIKITEEVQLAIPKNGYIIYYGNSIADDNYINARFKPGRTIELEYKVIHSIEENKPNTVLDLNKIEGIISAGPYLVKEGKIIANAENEGFKEDKITKNKAQRSAIGVTKDNKLLMVTCSNASINELAQIMLNLGAVEAINLDGGASSALFAKDKLITPPGRKLSTVLMIYDNSIQN